MHEVVPLIDHERHTGPFRIRSGNDVGDRKAGSFFGPEDGHRLGFQHEIFAFSRGRNSSHGQNIRLRQQVDHSCASEAHGHRDAGDG